MNPVVFQSVGYLVGFVVYRDLFTHAGVLRFGSRLLYGFEGRLPNLVLLLRLLIVHLADVPSRVHLGLLLMRLLGYLFSTAVTTATTAAAADTCAQRGDDRPQAH